MTRMQSWLVVAASLVADVVFLALAYYYATAAPGHPRIKHVIGFLVLCALSLLAAWYAFPKRTA
jgi:hypothetical protein